MKDAVIYNISFQLETSSVVGIQNLKDRAKYSILELNF